MSLDLPLVRGHVDPAVALRESVAPVALVRAGEADVILVDGAGFVLLDEAEASPSGPPVLRRLSGDEAVRATEEDVSTSSRRTKPAPSTRMTSASPARTRATGATDSRRATAGST